MTEVSSNWLHLEATNQTTVGFLSTIACKLKCFYQKCEINSALTSSGAKQDLNFPPFCSFKNWQRMIGAKNFIGSLIDQWLQKWSNRKILSWDSIKPQKETFQERIFKSAQRFLFWMILTLWPKSCPIIQAIFWPLFWRPVKADGLQCIEFWRKKYEFLRQKYQGFFLSGVFLSFSVVKACGT